MKEKIEPGFHIDLAAAVGAITRKNTELRVKLLRAATIGTNFGEHKPWCDRVVNGIDGDCHCGFVLGMEELQGAVKDI